MAAQWFVAHTYANREFRAAQEIQELGHRVFLPLEPVTLPASKAKIRYFSKPLFRNYIFVNFETEDDGWQAIGRKSSVKTLLGLNKWDEYPKPTAIPDHFITRVQGDLEARRAQSMPKTIQYAPGDKIRVTDGPFAGFEGNITELKGQDRVRVLLSLFGGQRPVDIKATQFERPAA